MKFYNKLFWNKLTLFITVSKSTETTILCPKKNTLRFYAFPKDMPYKENITNHYILVPFTCIYKFQQQKCEKSKLMAQASRNTERVFHNRL